LLQSQSLIRAEDYQAYLYMKNNISEAEANKGRTVENEAQFQLEKLAYSLGIVSVNITEGSNLITFVISKMRNTDYVFKYYIFDLKYGEHDLDLSLCSDLGYQCEVSKQGRWLQVYAFQNNKKLNEYTKTIEH